MICMKPFLKINDRARKELQLRQNFHRISVLSRQIKEKNQFGSDVRPVVFFNASTRLAGISMNAAYSFLSSYAIELAGAPVIHFVCKKGLSHCVLGTSKDKVQTKPPCDVCLRTSKGIYANRDVHWFSFQEDAELKKTIADLDFEQLVSFSFQKIPLGELVLPSLRWIIRRHHLEDDENSRYLCREYILSAWSIAQEFKKLITNTNPQAVVVFNGMFYPEALVRFVAKKHHIPVFTHEVGMQSFSAFFTSGEATAYPIDVSREFSLGEDQEARLNDYLTKRFQGDFVTAGIRFWPEMHKMDDNFWQKAKQFKQFVPVFTNVVFDTSQAHANVVFPQMFTWLDVVLNSIREHPETLFAFRAHPDELRPGKESRESVQQWVEKNQVAKLPNVIFIHSNDYMSSYDLIDQAKFVMVYNSTVGLEASIKGKPVLCAGKARYTQLPTVFFPKTQSEFIKFLNEFLNSKQIKVPPEFITNSRKVLYSQLFMASLPFEDFIEPDGIWNGFVRVKDFTLGKLEPENSVTMKTIVDGILYQGSFLLPS